MDENQGYSPAYEMGGKGLDVIPASPPSAAASSFSATSTRNGGGQSNRAFEKIRRQAQKLSKLQTTLEEAKKYSGLCEKRIRDFDPSHPMPIMQQHIGKFPRGYNKERTTGGGVESAILRKRLKTLLSGKKEADEKYSNLESKYPFRSLEGNLVGRKRSSKVFICPFFER